MQSIKFSEFSKFAPSGIRAVVTWCHKNMFRILSSLLIAVPSASLVLIAVPSAWSEEVSSAKVPLVVSPQETPYIISGFDDVLRQAENTGLIKAALKILEPDQTFSGMPELYRTISSNESEPKFALVSAISSWFENRIFNFLQNENYPKNKLYLRNWLTEWSIEKFKIEKIKEIIADHPSRKFIVIFDNSAASLRLTTELHAAYKETIVAIYLRQVVDGEMPEGATRFFTAFDIAYNEYTHGRMSIDGLTRMREAILKENDLDKIIPRYALCPPVEGDGVSILSTKNMKELSRPASVASASTELVRTHLQALCRKRH